MEFAKTYILYLEDHTMGNLLRMELMNNKKVKFAGYKVPHPLEDKVEIKIHGSKNNEPEKVLSEAISDLDFKLEELDR